MSLEICKRCGVSLCNILTCFVVSLCSVGALPPRVYVGHSIYKAKAALTLTPRPPEFAPLEVCMIKYFGFVGGSCY